MIADVDIRNWEGVLFLFLSFILGIIWKVLLPFWKKIVCSQYLLTHAKLTELREKEVLSEEEKDEFVDIVKDALDF
ncbi:MAG: hypothetical protein PHH48_06425 [Eubacteriales bacterium]|nr:hypothetical protein [Eubacteriales bacterium]